MCLDPNRKRWTCGIEARDRLAAHIGNRSIDCAPTGTDAYGRTLAVCTVAGEDCERVDGATGMGVGIRPLLERVCHRRGSCTQRQGGIWSGAFIAPWDWRHRNRQTVVLGAISVPISAQAELLAPESAADAPSPDCIIKGNVNRKGERIYFRPGQLDYAHVDMAKPGKRWFCTEDEAKAAGWRPAAR